MTKIVGAFAIFGPLIVLLGAYVAGGTEVICTRVGAPAEVAPGVPPAPVVGSCRVQTKRWLGRKIIGERTYLRVTGVDRIAVSRTESSTDSSGRSTSRTVDDWSLQLMRNGVEIGRIGGPRDKVDPAYEKGQSWFQGNAGGSLMLDFSEWRFAYAAMSFGAVWFSAMGMFTRLTYTATRGYRRPKLRQ